MKKILIVDDVENVRQAISLCLRLHGYQTVEAMHGKEALSKVSQYDIGLVLMDLVMPEMGGIAAAGRIREKYADMPVIFMSSYNPRANVKLAIDDDSSRFLAKPFPVKDLLEEIEKQMAPAGETITQFTEAYSEISHIA